MEDAHDVHALCKPLLITRLVVAGQDLARIRHDIALAPVPPDAVDLGPGFVDVVEPVVEPFLEVVSQLGPGVVLDGDPSFSVDRLVVFLTEGDRMRMRFSGPGQAWTDQSRAGGGQERTAGEFGRCVHGGALFSSGGGLW